MMRGAEPDHIKRFGIIFVVPKRIWMTAAFTWQSTDGAALEFPPEHCANLLDHLGPLFPTRIASLLRQRIGSVGIFAALANLDNRHGSPYQ